MATTIRRDAINYLPLALTNDATTTPGIPMRLAAGACIMVDSLDGASSLTFHVKEDATSATAYELCDAAGQPITQNLVAGTAFQMPTETFAAGYIALATNAGTAVVRYSTKG